MDDVKANPDLVTFIPAVTFTGYPDGVSGVEFQAGVQSSPVSEEYLSLLKEKGLVAPDPKPASAAKKA